MNGDCSLAVSPTLPAASTAKQLECGFKGQVMVYVIDEDEIGMTQISRCSIQSKFRAMCQLAHEIDQMDVLRTGIFKWAIRRLARAHLRSLIP